MTPAPMQPCDGVVQVVVKQLALDPLIHLIERILQCIVCIEVVDPAQQPIRL